jgi:EAL domain-containing protein (putative c-di-GMP-specific phosphodiesterase class I)
VTHSEADALGGVIVEPADLTAESGVQRVLRSVRTHLGMDVAFVSEFRTVDRLFTHVDAGGPTPIRPGDSAPLEQGYCQRVVDGRLPQLICNAQTLPASASLPETSAVPIGSHLSVPIRLRDGRVYGTFCCFSFTPDASLTTRDVQVMKAFADLLAQQIEEETQRSRGRTDQLKRIVAALTRGQPDIVFQPIYDLRTRRIAGVEALSRFNQLPQQTPDVWFSQAAAVGMGPALEAAAASSALRALDSLPPDVYVSLNASPEFITSGKLEEVLSRVDMTRVLIELTEHASITDYSAILHALAPLRAAGLRIAIDDAGAGYASMRHILSVEPDRIKLDISLTHGIDHDPKRRALASAFIAFGNETNIAIIAEGVETAAELECLQRLGVMKVQGYYLARPMPLAAINGFVSLPNEVKASLTSNTVGVSFGKLQSR